MPAAAAGRQQVVGESGGVVGQYCIWFIPALLLCSVKYQPAATDAASTAASTAAGVTSSWNGCWDMAHSCTGVSWSGAVLL
jgi:hypothetical protein